MKILQINAVAHGGSTGRTCKELSEFMNKNGDSCYTAFAYGISDKYSYKIGTDTEHRIHGLMSRLSGKQGYFSKFGTKKLVRYIKNLKPDVVHLRNLHSNYINLPILLNYLAKNDIPTVITLHDCWFYTGKCTHYTADGCYRWKTGCYDCPRLTKDNKSWFIDASSVMWKDKKSLFERIPRLAVTGVSDWITREAAKSFLSCAKITRRIYNWIDLDAFYPRNSGADLRCELNTGDKNIILGVASFWDNSKGLSDFIKLSKLLNKEYQIVLVGKLNENTIPDNIVHIPPTDSVDKLAEYYSMADVFVTFSLEETFGKVSAEAMACGTPVVCYDSTANPELVGPGCGYVAAPGDIEGVVSAIHKLCNSDKKEISAACREFAKANFDKSDRIADYIKLYEEIYSM